MCSSDLERRGSTKSEKKAPNLCVLQHSRNRAARGPPWFPFVPRAQSPPCRFLSRARPRENAAIYGQPGFSAGVPTALSRVPGAQHRNKKTCVFSAPPHLPCKISKARVESQNTAFGWDCCSVDRGTLRVPRPQHRAQKHEFFGPRDFSPTYGPQICPLSFLIGGLQILTKECRFWRIRPPDFGPQVSRQTSRNLKFCVFSWDS